MKTNFEFSKETIDQLKTYIDLRLSDKLEMWNRISKELCDYVNSHSIQIPYNGQNHALNVQDLDVSVAFAFDKSYHLNDQINLSLADLMNPQDSDILLTMKDLTYEFCHVMFEKAAENPAWCSQELSEAILHSVAAAEQMNVTISGNEDLAQKLEAYKNLLLTERESLDFAETLVSKYATEISDREFITSDVTEKSIAHLTEKLDIRDTEKLLSEIDKAINLLFDRFEQSNYQANEQIVADFNEINQIVPILARDDFGSIENYAISDR